MAFLWFDLPRSGVKKTLGRSVMYPIPVLSTLIYLKECVICGTVYVSEPDWAGREHLVAADPVVAGNNALNPSNTRQRGEDVCAPNLILIEDVD
jgi:hypothetical protein